MKINKKSKLLKKSLISLGIATIMIVPTIAVATVLTNKDDINQKSNLVKSQVNFNSLINNFADATPATAPKKDNETLKKDLNNYVQAIQSTTFSLSEAAKKLIPTSTSITADNIQSLITNFPTNSDNVTIKNFTIISTDATAGTVKFTVTVQELDQEQTTTELTLSGFSTSSIAFSVYFKQVEDANLQANTQGQKVLPTTITAENIKSNIEGFPEPASDSQINIDSFNIISTNDTTGQVVYTITASIKDANPAVTQTSQQFTLSGFLTYQKVLEAYFQQVQNASLQTNDQGKTIVPTNESITGQNIKSYINDFPTPTTESKINIDSFNIVSTDDQTGKVIFTITASINGTNPAITATSSQITVSDFLTINQQKVNQYIEELNKATLTINPAGSYIHATEQNITAQNINQYINGIPTPNEPVSISFSISSYDGTAGSISFKISATATNATAVESKSFTVSGFLSTKFNYYKPVSVNFASSMPGGFNWSPTYPSNITPGMFKDLLQFNYQSLNANYELPSTITNVSFGSNYDPSPELSIKIISADNATGQFTFEVYETVSLYNSVDLNNGVEANSNNTIQVKILPPSGFQSPTNNKEWILPSYLTLEKVKFGISFAPNNVLYQFVRSMNINNTMVTAVSASDVIQNGLFRLSSTNSQIEPPALTAGDITLVPDGQKGTLKIEVTYQGITLETLLYGFFLIQNGVSTQQQAQVQLTLPTQGQINTASINTPELWGRNEAIIPSVLNLSPSEFVLGALQNSNIPFNTIFQGTTYNGKNVLSVSIGPDNKSINAMYTLTYLGYNSGDGNLPGFPGFRITNVIAMPNDETGTLTLVVSYQTIDYTTMQMTPFANQKTITYSGFNKDNKNGTTLSLNWKSTNPLIDQNGQTIKDNYQKAIQENPGVNDTSPNGTFNKGAKEFVKQFILSMSSFLENAYNNTQTLVNLTLNTNNDNEEVITVEVNFTAYNISYITTYVINTFNPFNIKIVTPNNNSIFQNLPSQITNQQILSAKMIQVSVNNSDFADLSNTAPGYIFDMFLVPNDAQGILQVVLVLNLNTPNSPKYIFSNLFIPNFKTNGILNQPLAITNTNNVNLNNQFLTSLPIDYTKWENEATGPDKTSLYNNLQNLIFNNIFQQSNSVSVLISNSWFTSQDITDIKFENNQLSFSAKINWQQILDSLSNSNSSIAQNNAIMNSIKYMHSMAENSTNLEGEPNVQVLGYQFTGFNDLQGVKSAESKNNEIETTDIAIGIGVSLSVILLIAILTLYFVKRKYVVNKNK